MWEDRAPSTNPVGREVQSEVNRSAGAPRRESGYWLGGCVRWTCQPSEMNSSLPAGFFSNTSFVHSLPFISYLYLCMSSSLNCVPCSVSSIFLCLSVPETIPGKPRKCTRLLCAGRSARHFAHVTLFYSLTRTLRSILLTLCLQIEKQTQRG